MPARDAAATIGAAVSSVVWQTYTDLELVVVDDGSIDGTPEVARAIPGPVRVVSQQAKGVAAARNTGIQHATAPLLTFCDADDLLFPQHIEALVATYDATRAAIVTANAYWLLPGGIDTRRTRHKGRFPPPADQRMAILHQNFVSTMSLIPRSMAAEIDGFEETLTRAEDWDFWLRAIFAGHRVAHQPRPLALYRWSDSGLSAARDEFHAADREVLARALARADLTSDERSYLELRMASPAPRALASEADSALRTREFVRAARLYRQAAGLCPSETALVQKARLISVAPPLIGRWLRARQLRIEHGLGFTENHVR